jgi:hypothetical protein
VDLIQHLLLIFREQLAPLCVGEVPHPLPEFPEEIPTLLGTEVLGLRTPHFLAEFLQMGHLRIVPAPDGKDDATDQQQHESDDGCHLRPFRPRAFADVLAWLDEARYPRAPYGLVGRGPQPIRGRI